MFCNLKCLCHFYVSLHCLAFTAVAKLTGLDLDTSEQKFPSSFFSFVILFLLVIHVLSLCWTLHFNPSYLLTMEKWPSYNPRYNLPSNFCLRMQILVYIDKLHWTSAGIQKSKYFRNIWTWMRPLQLSPRSTRSHSAICQWLSKLPAATTLLFYFFFTFALFHVNSVFLFLVLEKEWIFLRL